MGKGRNIICYIFQIFSFPVHTQRIVFFARSRKPAIVPFIPSGFFREMNVNIWALNPLRFSMAVTDAENNCAEYYRRKIGSKAGYTLQPHKLFWELYQIMFGGSSTATAAPKPDHHQWWCVRLFPEYTKPQQRTRWQKRRVDGRVCKSKALQQWFQIPIYGWLRGTEENLLCSEKIPFLLWLCPGQYNVQYSWAFKWGNAFMYFTEKINDRGCIFWTSRKTACLRRDSWSFLVLSRTVPVFMAASLSLPPILRYCWRWNPCGSMIWMKALYARKDGQNWKVSDFIMISSGNIRRYSEGQRKQRESCWQMAAG